MDKFFLILVSMAAGCLLLSACGGTGAGIPQDMTGTALSATVGGTAENALVITPGIKGNSVSLKVGDTFEIQIPTIPTAGFNWEAKDLDTTILTQVGDAVFKADSDPAGAGGIVTLKFKAVGTGTTTLNLFYTQPVENGVPSLYKDTFGMTVEVK
jgi:predicted secreted protein/predicted small secreted protein